MEIWYQRRERIAPLMLQLASNLSIEKVVYALKLSNMSSASWLGDNFSSVLFLLTYGTKIFSKYSIIVNSLDQWLSEWVTCQDCPRGRKFILRHTPSCFTIIRKLIEVARNLSTLTQQKQQ